MAGPAKNEIEVVNIEYVFQAKNDSSCTARGKVLRFGLSSYIISCCELPMTEGMTDLEWNVITHLVGTTSGTESYLVEFIPAREHTSPGRWQSVSWK